MVNPIRALARTFVRRSPTALLAFGLALSFLDAVALYAAAAEESVLEIDQGVGLLSNFGLFTTVLGNALLLYLGSHYYRAVCSIWDSDSAVDSTVIERSLSDLRAKLELRDTTRLILYLLLTVGALAWISNVSSHVLGNAEIRWGHKVFDSPDHPLTFCASRLHNLVTWVLIIPFVSYVVLVTSRHLWELMTAASRAGLLKYDLLNPDQRGGFAFVDRAALAFNAMIAVAYVQITLHIETFKMNYDHIIAYVLSTIALIAINQAFLGRIYATVGRLKRDALNRVKDNVFKSDALSFEILKYYYDRKIDLKAVLNFAINPGAVVVSAFLKLWPLLVEALAGA